MLDIKSLYPLAVLILAFLERASITLFSVGSIPKVPCSILVTIPPGNFLTFFSYALIALFFLIHF